MEERQGPADDRGQEPTELRANEGQGTRFPLQEKMDVKGSGWGPGEVEGRRC